ncbi:MAG: FHA domain-containing protein, partial [Bacteriovorax sp.]|nr:FHA domain-containing protein [Bacteriovorax sp.]
MSTQKARIEITVSLLDSDESIALDGAEFIFGRSVKSDVTIKDPSFSRSHFKIYIKSKLLWIADLGSSNGTYINRKKMLTNATSPIKLGDVISVESSETQITLNHSDIYDVPTSKTSPKANLDETLITKSKSKEQDNPNETSSENNINTLMNKILEEANSKASHIIEKAIQIAEQKKDKIDKECQALIEDSEEKAMELKEQAKKKAILEFTDNIKNKIKKELAYEKELQEKNLITLIQDQKKKMLADQAIESQKIQDEHFKKKNELNNSLEQFEKKLAIKQHELSNVDKEIDIKKQQILDEMEVEFAHKLQEFQKTKSDLESTIELKKTEIAKLDIHYETKKNEQVKIVEIQIENRKFELQEEINEFDSKISKNKIEFDKLFENYEIKKNEQANLIAKNIEKKDKILAEIKSYELQIQEIKSLHDTQIEKNKITTLSINSELHKIKATLIEKQENLDQLSTQKDLLNKSISELQQKKENEEISLKKKHDEQLSIKQEIATMLKQKEAIAPQFQVLNNQLTELNKKIEIASFSASKLKADNAQGIGLLEKKYLEAKIGYEEEMRKLKASEEKRLQELLHNEMARINSLKEESLRLVVDLENSITKEISNASSKIFATTIGVDKYREIAPQFEKALRSSLQSGVLKLLQNELNPNHTNKAKSLSSSKKNWKPLVIGMTSSALVFGLFPYIYQKVQNQTDPIQQQLLADAEAQARAKIPVKKFTPEKVQQLGSTFVKSVIYTEDFCENYGLENFRSDMMKQGSVYLYKQWQIDEGKSIESFA